jgi:hypothetical protein
MLRTGNALFDWLSSEEVIAASSGAVSRVVGKVFLTFRGLLARLASAERLLTMALSTPSGLKLDAASEVLCEFCEFCC